MKRFLFIIFSFVSILPMAAKEQTIDSLLARLDSMIANEDSYVRALFSRE